MSTTTLALVGAAGGAGTTRTAVELAAMGARDGRDVTVLDAALATQGLAEHGDGRIDPDLTTLLTDDTDAPLDAATYRLSGIEADANTPGSVSLVPARAPFERLARAKTAAAARELERRIDAAAATSDAVIVDTAPVASNEAVAAVTSTDRVAGVYPASPHGRDALQRLRGRVTDVGATVDRTVAVARPGTAGADGDRDDPASTDADAFLPVTEPARADAPVATTGHGEYSRAIADAYGTLFDADVGVPFEDPGVLDRLR